MADGAREEGRRRCGRRKEHVHPERGSVARRSLVRRSLGGSCESWGPKVYMGVCGTKGWGVGMMSAARAVVRAWQSLSGSMQTGGGC